MTLTTLTRDDILRELELLPMWQFNASPKFHAHQEALPQLPINGEEIRLEEEVQQKKSLKEVLPQTSLQTSHTVERITIKWLLVSAPIKETICLNLLDSIIKAMRLSKEDYVIVQKRSQIANYAAERMVLFGLNVANAVCNLNETNIDNLRAKRLQLAQTPYIVTHSLQALVKTPSLKKQVWQDICLLLT